jgi:hypothetical protein
MPLPNFEQIFDEIKSQIAQLAKITVSKYATEAKKDADEFLESSREKLKKWTLLLAEGAIDTSEFEWLVNSQQGLAQMKLLTQAGLAQIRADQFKNAVLLVIVDVIFDKILRV